MKEKRMRSWIVRVCAPLHARPVENVVDPGYPDVEMVCATIECKAVEEWPVRETTRLLLHHYKKEQRLWAKHRIEAGGNHILMLCVGREWLLFRGEVAYTRVGHDATRAELYELADVHWNGLPDEDEFREEVQRVD
jgi:hypothetical protein